MNSLEAVEKIRKTGHEQEAKQYIEIFRSFCQWYQSEYNFEQMESTFWGACIYLIENHNLSEEKLMEFFLSKLQEDVKGKMKNKESLILQSMLICRSNIQKIKKWHQKMWTKNLRIELQSGKIF